MKRPNSILLLVLAALALTMPSLRAEQVVSLRVTPHVAYAPAVVSIRVTVEPSEQNRTLVVEDDSESYYRSSEVPLEGKNAARTYLLLFRGVPPGQHRVRAAVHGTSGLRASTSTTVTVIGFSIPE